MKEHWEPEALRRLIKFVDKSPAVTWTGRGGVKERLERLIEELEEEQ